jgi:phage baseplate assembly protein W
LTGKIAMVDDLSSIRQALLMLLSTSPGERVMRCDYGCALNHLVFSPNDDTTAGLAMHYVREAIRRWEPRVEVVRLDAGRADDGRPEILSIRIAYAVKESRRQDVIEFDIQLNGT